MEAVEAIAQKLRSLKTSLLKGAKHASATV